MDLSSISSISRQSISSTKSSSSSETTISSISKKTSVTSISPPTPSKTEKPKTKLQKFLKFLKIFSLIILLIIILYTILNVVCSINEKKQLKRYKYGIQIDFNNHTMIADVKGEQHEQTIVFLTGYETPSPVLHYKPLTEKLSEKYRVITLEPFGYGLSDETDEERTVEKIVSELHIVIQRFGIQQYYLMAHSIGGVYSLYWSNQHKNEVLGFIGLDITVPGKEVIAYNKNASKNINLVAFADYIGLDRMLSLFNKKNLLRPLETKGYSYTDQELELFKLITLQKGYNKTQRKEISTLEENLVKVEAMKFPNTMPVINYVCSENLKNIPNWKQLHVDIGSESTSSEVIEIEGNPISFPILQRDAIFNKVSSWIK